ncbi:MAG: hypothetical protein LBE80_07960 [Deltaproteobacteria bacterium]|jgi:intracellular multiplication protein IcmK|nr:hypothetical protein [Deltaproteobacteria bacterium]
MNDLLYLGPGENLEESSLWAKALDQEPLPQNQTKAPAFQDTGVMEFGETKAAFDQGDPGPSDLGDFDVFFGDSDKASSSGSSDFDFGSNKAGPNGPINTGQEKSDQAQLSALELSPEASNEPNGQKAQSSGLNQAWPKVDPGQENEDNLTAGGDEKTKDPNPSSKALTLSNPEDDFGQREPGPQSQQKPNSFAQSGQAGQEQNGSDNHQAMTVNDPNLPASQVSQGLIDPLDEKHLANNQKAAVNESETNKQNAPAGATKAPMDSPELKNLVKGLENSLGGPVQSSLESQATMTESLANISSAPMKSPAKDEAAYSQSSNAQNPKPLSDTAKAGEPKAKKSPPANAANKSAVNLENSLNFQAALNDSSGFEEKSSPKGSLNPDKPKEPLAGLEQNLVSAKEAQKVENTAPSKESENDQGSLLAQKADQTDAPNELENNKAPKQLANQQEAANQTKGLSQKDPANQTKGTGQKDLAQESHQGSALAGQERLTEPIKNEELPGAATGGSKGLAENDQGDVSAGVITGEGHSLARSFDQKTQTGLRKEDLSPDGAKTQNKNDQKGESSDSRLAMNQKDKKAQSRERPKEKPYGDLKGLEGLGELEGLEDFEALQDFEEFEDLEGLGDLEELEAINEERRLAYERSLEILLPTSPEEVKAYRKSLDEREEALSDGAPLAMRSRTERVRLEPGFKPPLIELSPNLVTALVFTDSTGSPWPVTATVLGSGNMFSVELLEAEGSNQIIVAPLSNHGHSNLVVSLKGKDIPLMARLSTTSAVKDDRELDGLIIFQVQESGPLARPVPGLDPKPTVLVDNLLYELLDGMTPNGARIIEAKPALEGESFTQVGPNLYLRTTRGLLWPAPKAKVSGPGGLAVYELPLVPSVMVHDSEEVHTVILQGVETDRIAGHESGP